MTHASLGTYFPADALHKATTKNEETKPLNKLQMAELHMRIRTYFIIDNLIFNQNYIIVKTLLLFSRDGYIYIYPSCKVFQTSFKDPQS